MDMVDFWIVVKIQLTSWFAFGGLMPLHFHRAHVLFVYSHEYIGSYLISSTCFDYYGAYLTVVSICSDAAILSLCWGPVSIKTCIHEA